MPRAGRFGLRYICPIAALALVGLFALWPQAAPANDAGPVDGLERVRLILALLATVLLCGSAFATAVHAEKVAERVGNIFGTLLLTLSVTIIEVSVIASMMMHQENNPALAREAVFSVLMIVNTGVIGLCLFLGSLRHREQSIQPQGVAGYLSVMIALGVLLLLLPHEVDDTATGAFSTFHLVFMSLVAVALYATFLYMQTVRYREHFADGAEPPGHHLSEAPPSEHGRRDSRAFAAALAMLALSLLAVVALSRQVAAGFEDVIGSFKLVDPDAVTGALLAALVLLPESITAVSAARRNQLQLSLNIALGSVLATIALTIPAMAVISVAINEPMVLALDARDRIMLLLTFVLAIISFGTGKTNVLNGAVHLIVFCVYVMLLFAP